DSFSPDFIVLAIARNLGSSFTASDGSVGTPYILVRGDVVAIGLSLDPLSATNPVGTDHTVTATLTHSGGSSDVEGGVPPTPAPGPTPVVDELIGFMITAGPNMGATGTCDPANCRTDSNGQVKFTYHDAGGAGDDSILAFDDKNESGAA